MTDKTDALVAALQAAVDWAMPMEDAPKDSRPEWFDKAREALAAPAEGATDAMVKRAEDYFYDNSPFSGPDELREGLRGCLTAALIDSAGGAKCQCVDCFGDQPKHDPSCEYMRSLHGTPQPADGDGAVEPATVLVREINRRLNGDILQTLLDVANGIDSPATQSTAASAVVRLDSVKELIEQLAAAPTAPAAQAIAGVDTSGLSELFDALDRGDRKGYLPDAIQEAWDNYNMTDSAQQPAAVDGWTLEIKPDRDGEVGVWAVNEGDSVWIAALATPPGGTP